MRIQMAPEHIQYLALCILLCRLLVKSLNSVWSCVRFEHFFCLRPLRGKVGGNLAEFNKISFSCDKFNIFFSFSILLTDSLFFRVEFCSSWIQVSESLLERMGSTRHRRTLNLQQSPHIPLLSPQDLRTQSRLVWGGRQVGALPGRGSGWSSTATDPLQGEADLVQGRMVGGVEWGKAFCCKPVVGKRLGVSRKGCVRPLPAKKARWGKASGCRAQADSLSAWPWHCPTLTARRQSAVWKHEAIMCQNIAIWVSLNPPKGCQVPMQQRVVC